MLAHTEDETGSQPWSWRTSFLEHLSVFFAPTHLIQLISNLSRVEASVRVCVRATKQNTRCAGSRYSRVPTLVLENPCCLGEPTVYNYDTKKKPKTDQLVNVNGTFENKRLVITTPRAWRQHEHLVDCICLVVSGSSNILTMGSVSDCSCLSWATTAVLFSLNAAWTKGGISKQHVMPPATPAWVLMWQEKANAKFSPMH